MTSFHDFHGPNAAYMEELHQKYLADPRSVDEATRSFFETQVPPARATPSALEAPAFSEPGDREKLMAAVNYAETIRRLGHLGARLDPLGAPPPGDPSLHREQHGLAEATLARLPASIVGGPLAARSSSALETIQALLHVYCSRTGYDYFHVRVPEERAWLRDAVETGRFRPREADMDPVKLLERLTRVEVFERFLQEVFPGKTRFSVEGLDMMIPILDEIIGAAADQGIHSVLMGMAHRGRLNVLAHVLQKPYVQLFAEFKDPIEGRDEEARGDLGWTGDVKYHLGACTAVEGGGTVSLTVCMIPNPSHLEHINPVIEGMARAAGTRVDSPGPPVFDPVVSLPILIHGDTSFPGQGVVAETLNFSRLPGYRTGGTIHIIANNQIGFTTEPCEGRSTIYASDLAKGFKIPILHVNADDPEACIEAARFAAAYRARFQKDFLIDLVGYRRHGHNEGDEPRFTQPLMYTVIERHPTVRELWARTLIRRGIVDDKLPDDLVRKHRQELEKVLASLRPAEDLMEPIPGPPPPGAARKVKTAVPAERLRALHKALLELPGDFHVYPKFRRVMERKRIALDHPDAPSIEWAMAESLAFASILEDGTAIRLTGEDVARGTFSHRHVTLFDMENGKPFTALQSLPQARASFEVRNSPLTECAGIGFEYGYNVQCPERLVIWEAQYGDFINVAQVMLDEFLLSARAKWGQTPSLVLLLPHGHEGQGPDHSSARLERFLNLAVDINLRIANCTTAAQYFHLLRRQAALLTTDPLPLVVLTPKSLLRHPVAASSLRDLSGGGWQPVLDDPKASSDPGDVRRLVLVSGKVYVDLVESEHRKKTSSVAVARVEQFYPLPVEALEQVLAGYPNLREVIWLQEEPQNMGAWSYMQQSLQGVVAGRWPLGYLGRPPSSSPAEGSLAWHALNQRKLVETAFRLEGRKAVVSDP